MTQLTRVNTGPKETKATSPGEQQQQQQQQQQNANNNNNNEPVQMKRSIGLWNGIAIIVGVIVGSGIFVSPKGVLEHSGSVGASLVVWSLCGLLALLGALCFAELGTSISSSGGEYTYIRLAYGPLPSFLYIWVIVVVIMPCGNAISALTFANYCLQPLFVSLTSSSSSSDSSGTHAGQPPEQAIRLLALAIIMLLIYINCASLNGSIKLQGSFTMAKVFALTLIIVYGMYYLFMGNPFKSIVEVVLGQQPAVQVTRAPPLQTSSSSVAAAPTATTATATTTGATNITAHPMQANLKADQSGADVWPTSGVWAGTQTNLPELARAFYSGFFTYSGWSCLNCVTEEIRSPAKNIPRAIVISITSVTLIYILANTAYFAVLTKQEMLESDAIAVLFGDRAFGQYAGWVMPLVVALSTMGGLNASIFAASRVYFAAARQGQLFNVIEMINIKSLTPVPALIFLGLTSSIYLVTTEITTLIEYMTFVEASFAALGVSTMLTLRYKLPELERPLRVPVLVPLVYLGISVAFLGLPLWSSPVNASIGIAITLTGLPAYYLTARWQRKPRLYQLAIDKLNVITQKLTLSVVPAKDIEDVTSPSLRPKSSNDE